MEMLIIEMKEKRNFSFYPSFSLVLERKKDRKKEKKNKT